MSPELQLRIFGFIDPGRTLPGSVKAKFCELAERGLTEEQIERLAATVRRMQDVTQSKIIDPIVHRNASLN